MRPDSGEPGPQGVPGAERDLARCISPRDRGFLLVLCGGVGDAFGSPLFPTYIVGALKSDSKVASKVHTISV